MFTTSSESQFIYPESVRREAFLFLPIAIVGNRRLVISLPDMLGWGRIMATIARLKQGGKVVSYKVITKKNWKILKTKRFKLKGAAQVWAKRVEADFEMMEALGSPGASITFSELCQA